MTQPFGLGLHNSPFSCGNDELFRVPNSPGGRRRGITRLLGQDEALLQHSDKPLPR